MTTHLVRMSSEELSKIRASRAERAALEGKIAELVAEVGVLTKELDSLRDHAAEQASGSILSTSHEAERTFLSSAEENDVRAPEPIAVHVDTPTGVVDMPHGP